MKSNTAIRFQIGSEICLSEKDPRWQAPFPVSLQQPQDASTGSDTVTYGIVFERLNDFLTTLLYAQPESRRASLWPGKPTVKSVADIAICLEKHGQFYHPCRLTWTDAGRSREMAVTLALGEVACNRLKNETSLLKQLKLLDVFDSLPLVFGFGSLTQDLSGAVPLAVMMGEWCHGYHEFHFSQAPDANQPEILLWSDSGDPFWLSRRQWYDLYFNVAAILTSFYNPLSSEQVFPWHHAAGDFVIKPSSESLTVKLITVRQYATLQDEQAIPEPRLLNGLLLFLLNLSIRTRIDRLDGVGDYHWAPEPVVEATLAGFFYGLKIRAEQDPLMDQSVIAAFREYLMCFTGAELGDLLAAICGSYSPGVPELVLISRHLSAHAKELGVAVAGMAAW